MTAFVFHLCKNPEKSKNLKFQLRIALSVILGGLKNAKIKNKVTTFIDKNDNKE